MAIPNLRKLIITAPFLLISFGIVNSAAARVRIQEPTSVDQPPTITGTQMAPKTPGVVTQPGPKIILAPMPNLPAPTGTIVTGPPPPRCNVDPAIEEVSVRKVSRNHVTFGFEIINLGTQNWVSDPEQQSAVFRVRNMRTGLEFYRSVQFLNNVPPGGIIASFTSSERDDLIDIHRGAQLNLRIFYTNNSADNKRCNDDIDMTNNSFRMEREAFSEFFNLPVGSTIGFKSGR